MRQLSRTETERGYLHRVEVVDIFDDYFSKQLLLVHDGRVAATYYFGLHLIHVVSWPRVVGLSSPCLLIERSRFFFDWAVGDVCVRLDALVKKNKKVGRDGARATWPTRCGKLGGSGPVGGRRAAGLGARGELVARAWLYRLSCYGTWWRLETPRQRFCDTPVRRVLTIKM